LDHFKYKNNKYYLIFKKIINKLSIVVDGELNKLPIWSNNQCWLYL